MAGTPTVTPTYYGCEIAYWLNIRANFSPPRPLRNPLIPMPSLWYCTCGKLNEMPERFAPGTKVLCVYCSTEHTVGVDIDNDPNAQNQITPKENWQPGVREFMEGMQDRMGLPPWATGCVCPACKKPFGPQGIRGLALCLNAQNFGDIVVEGHCQDEKCSVKSEHYFRKACQTVSHFSRVLGFDDVIREPTSLFDHDVLQPTAFQDLPEDANNVTEAMAKSKPLRGRNKFAVMLDDAAFEKKTEPADPAPSPTV